MENLADEHDKRAFILFCVYLPPNQEHRILVGDFMCKLNKVYERYKEAKIVVFGDMNMTREIFKEQIEKVLRPKFKCYNGKLRYALLSK